MKILKWVGGMLLILGVAMVACTASLSKKMPQAVEGDGDLLAKKMLKATHQSAWDTLGYLQWTFMGNHHYYWDKKANVANVQWGDNEVILDLDQVDGIAYQDGSLVTDNDKKQKLISKAWSFWCNDSFWMFANFKVNDPGVTREVVNLPDDSGAQGLKVTYQSGGVTPGDTYIWALGEDDVPTGYYMYVGILPVKGVYTSWDNWVEIGGALLSTSHSNKLFNMEMKNLKGGHQISDIDITADRLSLESTSD